MYHTILSSVMVDHIDSTLIRPQTWPWTHIFTYNMNIYTSYMFAPLPLCIAIHVYSGWEKRSVHGCGVGLTFCVYAGIEVEWRKTQCMPREVCVDVGREFGAPTNIFYKPPCVSVYRCGGCCHSEDKQCRNISTGYLSKTVSAFLFSSCYYFYILHA